MSDFKVGDTVIVTYYGDRREGCIAEGPSLSRLHGFGYEVEPISSDEDWGGWFAVNELEAAKR